LAAFFSAQVALLLNFLGGAICAHIAPSAAIFTVEYVVMPSAGILKNIFAAHNAQILRSLKGNLLETKMLFLAHQLDCSFT
jgi:hypothetical protein